MPVRALLAALLLIVGLCLAAPAADAHRRHHRAHHRRHHHKHRRARRHVRRAHASRRPVAAAPAPAACADTQLIPTAADLARIRSAIVCLHNLTRAEDGLSTLDESGALDAAALGHSSDMVARRYFDHTTPDGGSFVDRILAAGYTGRHDAWRLGENLAWGTGPLSTPAALMQAWMNSPEHRANVLGRGYREIGVGLRLGTPSGDGGVTVSIEFGARG